MDELIRQFLAAIQPKPIYSNDLHVTYKTLQHRKDFGITDDFPIYLTLERVPRNDLRFVEIKRIGEKYKVFLR
ncbi:hypothetical protein [Floridanema aerugineum]|uniref:Uncharacterized protein n=1 Tax=Floridaenema aerugineum BLCC-F46 TaxID=3153654 RepID=A0ABV4X2A4_9CYAN